MLCLGTVSGVMGTSAAGAATSGRTILAGSVLSAQARQHPAGAVSKSARVDFNLVLNLRDRAAAVALLRAVSTPGSASYRHYLTTTQWESRFSPSAKTVSTARAWLRSQGFAVSGVSKDRMTISASGTAAQVEKAFGTSLGYFKVAGHTVRLATRAMSVPASIAGSVVGAMGVNQSIARPAVAATAASSAASAASQASSKINFPPPPAAFLASPPCGSFYNQKIATVKPSFGHGYPNKVPYNVCGYKPGQFRSAYNVGSATGQGATVAIVNAYGSATIASDSTRYFRMNDPGNPFANAHLSQVLAAPFTHQAVCGASGWLTEQAIDVQSVHSVARHAHIVYVGARSCFNSDLFKADQRVVDNRLADVLTNSFGSPSGDVLIDRAERTANDNLFLMAGSIGMTVSFSTGDDGDNFDLTGISAPSFPASSPFVTAVGGTSLQIGRSGKVIGQVGWATGRSFKCTANAVGTLPGCTKSALNTWLPVSYDGGSGGYTSYNYAQPWYQAPVVPASLASRNEFAIGSAAPMRVIPDISLDADPSTGFLIGLRQTFPNGTVRYSQPRFGGTSLASPLLAGVIANVDGLQRASGGSDVGFINPTIYRLVRSPGGISDVLPGGKQAQLRVDHAIFETGGKGSITSFRQLTYEGPITFCDGAGNCATRDNTLSTAKGYDSMTGLGSPGPHFITDLGKS